MTETTLEKDPATGPGLRGTTPVHNLLGSLDLKLRWSLLGNAVLATALTISAFGHLWTLTHPPTPEYFAPTADGQLIPLISISAPYVPQEVLLTWAAQPVTTAYTLD